MMQIISVVPRLPPAIDGVGDYALYLAQKMHECCGIETLFISGDPCNQLCNQPFYAEGFAANPVTTRSAISLFQLLEQYRNEYANLTPVILLHYVGYGYAKRGCPLWLIEGLKAWKDSCNAHLITMFHELYHPFESMLKSGTWLSFFQKRLATQLAQLSDRCVTTRQHYAKHLSQFRQGQHPKIPTLPVFSNIGEPKKILPLAKRQPRLIIFGQRNSKCRVYQKSTDLLHFACQALKVREIWDIGPSTNLNIKSIHGIPVVEIGEQPAAEISTILATSIAGFFNYSAAHLTKSGIFAAYCSHGLIPIGHCLEPDTAEGIEADKHYWMPVYHQAIPDHLNLMIKLQIIANAAYDWYQTHHSSIHAYTFAQQISEVQTHLCVTPRNSTVIVENDC